MQKSIKSRPSPGELLVSMDSDVTEDRLGGGGGGGEVGGTLKLKIQH